MGRKKKPFIDKKSSTTYHLYDRSQRDVNYSEDNTNILFPTTTEHEPTAKDLEMAMLEEELQNMGMKEEEYDYDQHIKPITGAGIYYSRDGRRVDRPMLLQKEEVVEEVPRQLESITLTAECMEEDIAHALFDDYDEGEFEEILDDFCITANMVPEKEEEEDGFDYDAHIAALIRKVERDEGGDEDRQHEAWQKEQEFFDHLKPMRSQEEPTPSKDALEQKFEETLLEYDSDDLGDLDNECEEIDGFRSLETDAQVHAALDEFLQEHEDTVFMHAPTQKSKGGSYKALVGTTLVPIQNLLPQEEDVEPIQDTLEEANKTLSMPEMEPPPEEVLIDNQSYFTVTPRNPWDCESILSTYSNSDNHPTTIGRSRSKKKPVRKIELSKKTGLPLGVLPGTPKKEHSPKPQKFHIPENETKEEKKARKQAVKEMKHRARMQKKTMKEAFREEFQKRNRAVLVDDVGGKSVFRYS